MKYCPKCSKVFNDSHTVCEHCKKPLQNTVGSSDPVCVISADGFERERIVAALKDNGVPCTEKMCKKERSADAVTGVNAASVEILVPYAALEKANDILIGIGAIKLDDEQILNEDSTEDDNSVDESKEEKEISSKKRIAIRIFSAILLVVVACALIWGLDYIISFIQNLFGLTNTTNVNL